MLDRYLTALGKQLLNRWLHALAILLLIVLVSADEEQVTANDQIVTYLYNQLAHPDRLNLSIQGLEFSSIELKSFYARRHYKPVWINDDSSNINAHFLTRQLLNAESEGLTPGDYQAAQLASMLKTRTELELSRLELMLTIAYAKYATHLRNGRLDRQLVEANWPNHPEYVDALKLLENGLENNSLFDLLFQQAPPHKQYIALRSHLVKLRDIQKQGGWQRLPDNALLKPDYDDNRIIALRHRLIENGDLELSKSQGKHYDQDVVLAVSQFQRRHGILVDGIAGKETLDVLNTPVEARIKQTILNMERWRMLPRKLGRRYIMVNAAGFELIGVNDDEVSMEMRVIVGERELPTPVFSSRITHLVLNPEWNVPRSIAVNELLKKVKHDSQILQQKGYSVIQGWNDNEQQVNPAEVNWDSLSDRNFPYRLRQLPGPQNPLGRIKFSMPNPYDVYLHDTPNRMLFENVYRDMSHGCIRLEQPMKLARFLLRGDSTWSNDKINLALQEKQTLQINIAEPVPVHILYFTAWVNEQGQISYYNDVYQNDKLLISSKQTL